MERVLEQVWNEAKTLGNDVDNAILHNTYVYICMYIYIYIIILYNMCLDLYLYCTILTCFYQR